MASFSAALLVGGESKRMGRDKALMRDAVGGEVFWRRQLGVLEELRPEEIFWSGPTRPGMPADVRLVEDSTAQAGPLAGISACLNILHSDLLVVLAIDLPRMNADFLRRLLAASTPGCGMAMKRDVYFEPLAAVYPKAIGALAEAHLHAGRYVLQELLGEAERRGMMRSMWLGDEDEALFKNVNEPGDF